MELLKSQLLGFQLLIDSQGDLWTVLQRVHNHILLEKMWFMKILKLTWVQINAN